MSFADDLQNLDPNNPGLWPKAVQIVLFVILFFALLFAGWKFDITKLRDELSGLEKKELDRIDTLQVRQRKAANLNALKEQMKEMEISFGDMVRQLPNQTEVAGLLVDISQTGLGAGLDFKLFEPIIFLIPDLASKFRSRIQRPLDENISLQILKPLFGKK